MSDGKKFATREERVGAKIYRYNGRPQIQDDAFLLPGDYLYDTTQDEGTDGLWAKTFVSSRGFVLGYRKADEWGDDLKRALDSGELQPGAAQGGLDAVRSEMSRQQMYQDAEYYKADPARDMAEAVFHTGSGRFSLQREGEHVTLAGGISMPFEELPVSDYKGFNPSGMDIRLETEYEQYRRHEKEKAEATPLGKAASAVRGMAMKLAGAGLPPKDAGQAKKSVRPAEYRVYDDLAPSFSFAKRGAEIEWTACDFDAASGKWVPQEGVPPRHGIILDDNGVDLHVMELFNSAEGPLPEGRTLVPIRDDRFFLDGEAYAATDDTLCISAAELKACGVRHDARHCTLLEEETSALERGEATPHVKRDYMRKLAEKLEQQDRGNENDSGPDREDGHGLA